MSNGTSHFRSMCAPEFCGLPSEGSSSTRLHLQDDEHVPEGGLREPSAIDHPEYYGGGDNPYEAIKVIQAWELDFELGSALKYIARAGKKTPSATTDLGKAIRYLQFELEKLERGR